MNKFKTCAFAICAYGNKILSLREHLVAQLHWYAPGIDIVDIDLSDVRKCLGGVDDKDLPCFAKMAIPKLEKFRKYNRVVYLDVDVEIKSGLFSGILDVDTSKDGLAACPYNDQQNSITRIKSHLPEWNHAKYFDCDVMVMDLDKIDVEAWMSRISNGLAMHTAKPFALKDQDILNALFEFNAIDSRFNCLVNAAGNEEKDAAWLWNFLGCNDGHIMSNNEESEQKYVVVSIEAGNVIRWLRSYFNVGDGRALVVISGNNWSDVEIEYCKAAIEFCGGVFIHNKGKQLSDDDIRQTLDSLHISTWGRVESNVDINGNALLDTSDAYPELPFEHSIGDMARKVKVIDVKLPRLSDDDAIDAVFVIGKGSKHNNEELRYALRNIAKHCPFVRDVYISGECPDWVDKSVVKHLKWPDNFQHAKDANIIDKLRHACEQKGIAKRILFCSDDQFQTRICTWEDFEPRYLRQYSPDDTWYAERERAWHTRLRNTLERDRKRRESLNLDTSHIFYYEPHMWMQIDRDKFIEYAKWSDYEHRTDTIIASGYFNFVDSGGRPHDREYDHVFIGASTKTLPKVTHIAYTDEGFDRAISFLKQLFPDRCIFEVENPAHAVASVRNANPAKPLAVAKPLEFERPVRNIDKKAIKDAIRKRMFGTIYT